MQRYDPIKAGDPVAEIFAGTTGTQAQ